MSINEKSIVEKIIDFIGKTNGATIGEIYVKFHMMNKGNEFSHEGDMPISAKYITLYVDKLCKEGVLSFKKENNEVFYYLNTLR